MKKKLNRKLKITLIVLLVMVVVAGGSYGGFYLYLRSHLSKVNHTELPKDLPSLGIDSTKYNNEDKTSDDIVNILLLGVDSRDPKDDASRSDSMMVLTIDKKHNKLKLTSIMRDSLVNIEGHGQEKITHAHAYGGALLSIKTVNQNYNLNIMNYVQVNFFGLEKIIDYIGGVQVNVSKAELSVANKYISETAKIENKTPSLIANAGLQNLNGAQAVAYARIRYVGNADFQRTERQRVVLTALFKKLSSRSITDIPGAMDSILPYVETSLKPDDMISTATYILTHNMTNVEQSRVPYDDLYNDAVVNGMDVLTWNKEETLKRMHQFIFEEQ